MSARHHRTTATLLAPIFFCHGGCVHLGTCGRLACSAGAAVCVCTRSCWCLHLGARLEGVAMECAVAVAAALYNYNIMRWVHVPRVWCSARATAGVHRACHCSCATRQPVCSSTRVAYYVTRMHGTVRTPGSTDDKGESVADFLRYGMAKRSHGCVDGSTPMVWYGMVRHSAVKP